VGALLGIEPPAGSDVVPILDEASVAVVREAARRLGGQQGLPRDRIESLIAAASELGHNQLAHARLGRMWLSAIEREGVAGLEIAALDAGPGIADPTAAMAGQTRGAGSLGVGISAAYRLADEMDFDVRLGEGTYAAARAFATPVPRSEVAVFGRPITGEPRSGDDAGFVRSGGVLLVGLADGLGHGPEAREASERAMDLLRRHGEGDVSSLLEDCHGALQGTRGAVMAAARFDRRAGELRHAAAGNISTHLYWPKASRRLVSASRVLGAAGAARPRPVVERESLERRPLLLMFSDGVSSRADLADDLELLRQPALVIAHQVLARFGRTTDDALVLVAT
jgi:anti-sigma regulatory factor (Ser/Thr protein kinase)